METVATAIAAAVEQAAAREITNSVQLVTATTSSAAEAMHAVLSIAESRDATSLTASQAADEAGSAAMTLQAVVADFLSGMSHGSEAERRLYERIDGNDMKVTLQVARQSPVQATIKDIARVMAGLVPAIHDFLGIGAASRGWPGHARPRRS